MEHGIDDIALVEILKRKIMRELERVDRRARGIKSSRKAQNAPKYHSPAPIRGKSPAGRDSRYAKYTDSNVKTPDIEHFKRLVSRSKSQRKNSAAMKQRVERLRDDISDLATKYLNKSRPQNSKKYSSKKDKVKKKTKSKKSKKTSKEASKKGTRKRRGSVRRKDKAPPRHIPESYVQHQRGPTPSPKNNRNHESEAKKIQREIEERELEESKVADFFRNQRIKQQNKKDLTIKVDERDRETIFYEIRKSGRDTGSRSRSPAGSESIRSKSKSIDNSNDCFQKLVEAENKKRHKK